MDSDRLAEIKSKLRQQGIYQRKLALDELATISAEEAIPILHELLQERDFALRKIAVMGLGNHPTEQSFAILQNVLAIEQDVNVLAEAANSLWEFGDRSWQPLKQLFINSHNWLVRQTVIAILVDCDDPELLLEIADLAIADQDQTTKETGILALYRLLNTPFKQQALEIFTILSEADDWRTRWRTAIALAQCQDPQAIEILSKLRTDEHYRVVAATLESNQ